MPANKKVHAFAVKWSDKFRDSKTVTAEIEDPAFADACFSLGFKMDCGKAFMSAYPDTDAFHDYRELSKIVDHIRDTQLLGSAIFSRWRYFTHWAGPGTDILAFENRSWFITAFGRLERLTAHNKTSSLTFHGCARKVQIISNNICFGPHPSSEDEMEQHLSISADGSVFFSAYTYGDGTNHVRTRMKSFILDAERAAHILKMIGNYFSDEHDMEFSTDVGNWKMTITNTENKPYHFRGSLCAAYEEELDDISNLIRLNLNMPELLVFDGRANSDRMERIVIDYHRITKIKPDVIPEGSSWEYATWDYSEHFLIDRESETLEHVQKIGSRCQVSRKYQVEGGITALLDDIYVDDFFANTKGNPPDAIVNPFDTRDYSITVDFLYGGQKILTGTYDINELPDGFVDFLQTVSHFMRFYGMGEIFDPAVYGKPLRKQTDCIFCNVQFDDYGKTYCYLTDDDSLEVGDSVVVPAGKNYREAVAKIESIEYHSAEDAPFPWDKIKKIVRKHENTKDENSADGKDTVKLSEETMIMGKDPLAGVSAEMWRNILGDDYTESALAASLADVWNEVGWLMHEVDDEDCASAVKERYESWCLLQLELIQKVAAILQCECKTPYIKLLTPFMERNGYRDVGGLWVGVEGINGN
ncbi:MAG: hypothetical protein VB104_12880 [Candidatus Limiplasma sp.]|nr:hypothetical protein [Candidatus Limiplasma sp.]